ncbi:MAG: ABC transporter permease [Chthoniobacterales bacterium]
MLATYISSQRLSLRDLLLPWRIIASLSSYRSLLKQFTTREIEKRYKGTLFGFLWSLITPLMMLIVYTIVFGFIFHGSYGHPGETKIQFALGLFCGLLVWDFIAGCIALAPALMVNNANFVTKVIFPLEILPMAMVFAALVHTAIGFVPLVFLLLISQGSIPLTAFFLPSIFIPILFYALGTVWTLSALGVFLRDIVAMMPAVLTTIMFMSAIFFPITVVPASWQWVIMINPVAVLISMVRNAVVFGQSPDFNLYFIQVAVSLFVAIGGYALFMKVKPAFADVL